MRRNHDWNIVKIKEQPGRTVFIRRCKRCGVRWGKHTSIYCPK